MNCLENCDDPIESPTIARSLGDGFNVWTVRENLQLLKDIGVVQKIDKDGWILSNKIMKTGMTLKYMLYATNICCVPRTLFKHYKLCK